jgi:HEPN domain-containing protein
MTPQELRQNAWTKVKSARSLLAAGSLDDAAYLAGYAVELVLKARYCTRAGWADFPSDAAEIRRIGGKEVLTHDLERLLTLAEGTSLAPNTLHHIDWNQALDWDVEQRYRPVGSLTKENVEAQIRETEKLFLEMVLYEIVEKAHAVEIEIENDVGPFNLFAVVNGLTAPSKWELMISAWWLGPDPKAKAEEVVIPRLQVALDEDLLATIPLTSWWHPRDEWVQRFHTYPRSRHSLRYLTSHNVVWNRFMPPAFVIANVPWSEPASAAEPSQPPSDIPNDPP